MSWEEDYLMRRVGELTAALKEANVLEECANCTTLYAADLNDCPNCGHPKGEPKSRALSGPRPTPLGVESTAGANALPPQTVHGGANPNAVTAEAEEREQDDESGEDSAADDTADDGRAQETIDGEPRPYEESNVETLRAEIKRRRDEGRSIFVPSGANKDALISALRSDDRARAGQV